MRMMQSFLDSGDALGRLNREARRLAKLDQAYKRSMADRLAEASGVSHIQGATLYLWADGGAVAAKLRQLAPTVLVTLRNLAPEIDAVRVTVRMLPPSAGRSAGAQPALSEEGVVALRGLAHSLPPSPLKTALSRLAGRGRTQSENGK